MVLPGTAIEFDKRYKVISIIGRGRETVVYRAESIEGDKKEVAIKVLSGKKHADLLLNRLKHEATMLLLAEHPRVISIFGMHAIKDYIYLALEYAPMGDLFRLTNYGTTPLPTPQAQTFFLQCLEGLAHLEKVAIIHRDIKPDNILVTGLDSVKIGDFGVASMASPNHQRKDLHLAVGAISYLAPEILDGQVCDFQSDLYALALSFYHIISGTHPFDNAPLVEQKTRRETLDIPNLETIAPNCPPKMAKAIMKMLNYSRENRFPSAAAVIEYLKQKSEDRPSLKQLAASENPTPQIQNAVTNRVAANSIGTDSVTDADIMVGTTAVKVPTYKVASIVTKPSVEIESSLMDDTVGETHVINNQRLVKHPNMARETDKHKRDEQATQSIPKDMLDRFRMGGTGDEAREEKRPHNSMKDQSSFSVPETGSYSEKPRRGGMKRLILAVITCVVVAVAVIGFYLVSTASEYVSSLAREGVGTVLHFVGGSSKKKHHTTEKVTAKTKNESSSTGSTSFGPSDADGSVSPEGPDSDSMAKDNNEETQIPVEDLREKSSEEGSGKLSDDTEPTEESTSRDTTPSQTSPAETLVFKGGVHAGLITGLFPQGPTHVSFVPLPDSTDVVVIVGLDGWTPRRGEMVAENTLKVSSNGIVLQFKGSTKDASHIGGRVEDLVTGKQGSWEVEALSKD